MGTGQSWGADGAIFAVATIILVGTSVLAMPALAQQDAADVAGDLSCVDESHTEMADRISSLADRGTEELPASLQSRIAGERIEITIGDSTKFTARVDPRANVQEVSTGSPTNPTLLISTDCETIDRIAQSATPQRELEGSVSNGAIDIHSPSPQRDAAVSYGSKAVQTYHIASEGDTGTAGDAADGFRNGLVMY